MNKTKVEYVDFNSVAKVNFNETLMGKTIESIDVYEDRIGFNYIVFHINNGEVYVLHHEQDCCEKVYIEDIIGKLDNLIGNPITMADESINKLNPANSDEVDESVTWTFYKLATVKGYATIRWYGSSNGYYSEKVEFVSVENLNIEECEEK